MDDEQAVFVLARENRRAALEEAERLTALREAEEATWASEKAAAWKSEYQELLQRRPGLRAELQATDEDLVKAVAELQAAHAKALGLLLRRQEAEQRAVRLNSRLSRLASWISDGRIWTDDALSVPRLPEALTLRVLAFVNRPWPL